MTRFRYDRDLDQFIGDAENLASGWPQFEQDELEVGGRAAMGLDDPDQAFFEIYAEEIRAVLENGNC